MPGSHPTRPPDATKLSSFVASDDVNLVGDSLQEYREARTKKVKSKHSCLPPPTVADRNLVTEHIPTKASFTSHAPNVLEH